MQMKSLLNEWRRYLTEGTENHFEHNFQKILQAIKNSNTKTNDFLVRLYREFGKDNYENKFKEILLNDGADKVLKDYKIKSILGSGSIGIAFSLEPPHENYVLKIQISESSVGTDFLRDLYNKQEQGIFDPKEVRVLEAFETKYQFYGATYMINIFVTSKVAMSNIAGKTGQEAEPEDFFADISEAGVDFAVAMFRASDKGDLTGAYYKRQGLKSITGLKDEQVTKLMELYEKGSFKNAMRYLYKLKEADINIVSRDQFVALAEEFYKRYNEALDAGIRSFDFHGGNFGFRPNSDVPMPFDI